MPRRWHSRRSPDKMKYDGLTPFTDVVTDTWMRSVNTQKCRGWRKIHARKMLRGAVKSSQRCVTGCMTDARTEEKEKNQMMVQCGRCGQQ